MSQPVLGSVLADRFADFVAFQRSGGADYRARARVLSYFDRFLCRQGFGAPYPTREILDRYWTSLEPSPSADPVQPIVRGAPVLLVVPSKNIVHLVQQRLMEFFSRSSRPRILRAMREIRCLFQIILQTISDLKQAAGYIYTFLSALFSSKGNFGGTSLGGRKSVGRVQASDRGEGSTEAQIHPGFQTALGVAVQGLG